LVGGIRSAEDAGIVPDLGLVGVDDGHPQVAVVDPKLVVELPVEAVVQQHQLRVVRARVVRSQTADEHVACAQLKKKNKKNKKKNT
jgi:hypothetical protein